MLAVAVASFALVAAGCGGEKRAPTAAKLPPEAELNVPTEGWRTDFTRHTVPLREFLAGGPGKDGIPALDRPRFEPVSRAVWLRPREPVIELALGGEARAYPLQILTWHEIVNDRVGGVPVAVTFCPLCNTAIAFDRRVGRTLSFGTTGNLRNSDLVMYDRQTESWWQQIGGEGVVGRHAGSRLREVPARIVAWSAFRRAHPDGRVLTRDTGYSRPYGRNPYAGYDDVSSSPVFPAANADDRRLQPKERVVFLQSGGDAVAVPFATLERRDTVEVTIGGRRIVVRASGTAASALDSPDVASGRSVLAPEVTADGRPVTFSTPFWFAVAAFRPDVRIIR